MYFFYKGVRVFYKRAGEPKAVFLHGWGGDSQSFSGAENYLNSLGVGYVAPDLPGFGKSDEPTEAWNVDNYVDFVVKFLSELGVKKATFLGHSFGGRVIIKMFEKDSLPFEITKIILADSAGVLPKKSFKQKAKIRSYKIGKAILQSAPVHAVFPNAIERFKAKSGSADYRAASPIMRQTLVRVVNEDLTPLFPKVTPPTLLIWGKDDTATPVSDADLMEKMMPDAGKVVFEHCGHYSFLDQKYRFERVLASFMNIDN